jgi:hypothetical protein
MDEEKFPSGYGNGFVLEVTEKKTNGIYKIASKCNSE